MYDIVDKYCTMYNCTLYILYSLWHKEGRTKANAIQVHLRLHFFDYIFTSVGAHFKAQKYIF
jgi:hypothetical protein